jgi:LysM repeat protein
MEVFVKKVLIAACIAFFLGQVSAAEYIVKSGDCLSIIAIKTNTSVCDLVALNEIQNQNQILPGQKIKYLVDQDLADAQAWAKKQMSEPGVSNGNYMVFDYVAEDIENHHIRYSVSEPNGAHADLILSFASAWRENR